MPDLRPAVASSVFVGPGMTSTTTLPNVISEALEVESMDWRSEG
ncbi:hypothetical protein BSU04_36145 [Caballeronia sordidicola]|uniref:Uncharacterized protein n=1 Tax=Caballeronia sordidicola TaxID=196367 RepID=A0A226WR07_CABSO|nr:hypothetical protein BSU04_36145 [Caballeronia sordidicola]